MFSNPRHHLLGQVKNRTCLASGGLKRKGGGGALNSPMLAPYLMLDAKRGGGRSCFRVGPSNHHKITKRKVKNTIKKTSLKWKFIIFVAPFGLFYWLHTFLN